MFSSNNHIGRLVELRVTTPISTEEILELRKTHLAVTQAVDGEFVVAVDMRQAHVFPPAISEAFIGLMSQLNPRLLRSAVLINHGAVLGLQAERAIRAAGNPDRRTFRESQDLEAWLSPVLDDNERRRLHTFLGEGPIPAAIG